MRATPSRRALVATAAVLLTGLAACGDDSSSSDTTAAPAASAAPTTAAAGGTATTAAGGATSGAKVDGKGMKVGMALPGPKNDKGFSQAHYEGLLAAEKDLNIVASVVENAVSPEATVNALKNLAADNKLVIGVGAEFDEAGKTVAEQFPDVEFMIINGSTDPALKNLHAYGVRQGVPAYIAGVVAVKLADGVPDAKVTKAGYVGGLEIPPVTQADAAWKASVKATSSAVEALSTITGDFNDVAKAKTAAAAQIAAGAEVVYGLVDAGFTGVIQAAQEAGSKVYLMSSIYPRCEDYPKLLGTAILNSGKLVESMISDDIAGTIPAQPKFYGVEDPDIQRFELCPTFASTGLKKVVDDTTAGINDGSIKLPDGV